MSIDTSLVTRRVQCEHQLQLLYFPLRLVGVLFNVFNSTKNINPFACDCEEEILPQLKGVQQEREQVAKVLCSTNLDHQVLNQCESRLANCFKTLQYLEHNLAVNLELFLSQKPPNHVLGLSDLRARIAGVKKLTAEMCELSTRNKTIPDLQIAFYEEQGKAIEVKAITFKNSIIDPEFKTTVRNLFLSVFFGDLLAEAQKQQLRILLLYRWQEEVVHSGDELYIAHQREGQNVEQNFVERWAGKFKHVLRTKKLLFDYKIQFYKTFYASSNRRAVSLDELFRRVTRAITTLSANATTCVKVAPQQIFTMLNSEESGIRAMVLKLEEEYRDYSWTQGALTALTRLVTKTPYYEFSEAYFALAEELTDKETGIYPTETKLSDEAFGIGAAFGAVALGGICGYANEKLGANVKGNYTLFNFGIEALTANLDSCIFYWGNMLGCNAERLVQNLPRTRSIVGLGAALGVCALTFGITAPATGYIVGGYMVGTTCKDVSNLLLLHFQSKSTAASTQRCLTQVSPFVNYCVGLGGVVGVCALTLGISDPGTKYVVCSYLAGDLGRDLTAYTFKRVQTRLTAWTRKAFDTENLLQVLPIVRWTAGLGVAMGTCALTVGFMSPATSYVVCGYVVGTGCRALSGRVLAYAKKRVASSQALREKFFNLLEVLPSARWCIGLGTTFAVAALVDGMGAPITRDVVFAYMASTTLGELSRYFFGGRSSVTNAVGIGGVAAMSILIFGVGAAETNKIIVYSTLGYTFNSLCGYVIDDFKYRIRNRPSGMRSKEKFEQLLEILFIVPLQQAAFVLGNSYLAPKLHNFATNIYVKLRGKLKPDSVFNGVEIDRLLTDPKYCLQNPIACEQKSRQVLALSENASAEEIESSYRSLMLTKHPDKVGTEGDASLLNAAKENLHALASKSS